MTHWPPNLGFDKILLLELMQPRFQVRPDFAKT
jgi:hypothetical protein